MTGDDADDIEDADEVGEADDPGRGAADEETVARGVEALQSAAREMIAAARAVLDVADELVQDPQAVSSVVEALGTAARSATRLMPGAAQHRGGGDDDGDDDGGVRRIPVS